MNKNTWMLALLLALGAFNVDLLRGQDLDEWDTSPLRPYDIAVLDDGSVWVNHRDDSDEDPYGRIFTVEPMTGVITTSVAEFTSKFYTIDAGSDGTIWLADAYHRLVRYHPVTREFTRHELPEDLFTSSGDPLGFMSVHYGPEGLIWFTSRTDVCIGVFDPDSESWARFDLLNEDGDVPGWPVELAFDGSDGVWFTIKKANREIEGETIEGKGGLGRLNPRSGEMEFWLGAEAFPEDCFAMFDAPTSPHGMTVVDDIVWFLDHHANTLISFDPRRSGGSFQCFPLIDEGGISDPHYLVSDSHGTLWITSFAQHKLIAFDIRNGSMRSVDLADGSFPMGIDVYIDDHMMAGSFYLWVAESYSSGHGGVARYYHPPPIVPERRTWGPFREFRRLNLVDCAVCPECFDRPCDPRLNPDNGKFAIWDVENDILESFDMSKLGLKPGVDDPLSAAAPLMNSRNELRFVAAAPNARNAAGKVVFFDKTGRLLDQVSGERAGDYLGRSMDVRGNQVVVASSREIMILEDFKVKKSLSFKPEMYADKAVHVAFTDDVDGDFQADILLGLPFSTVGRMKEAGQILLLGSRSQKMVPVALGRKPGAHIGRDLYPFNVSFSQTQQLKADLIKKSRL